MLNGIDRARAALFSIPPDLPREEWHETGRAAISVGLSLEDIDQWSASAQNYKSRRDVEASFRPITPDGGTGAGTLFHIAKKYGYTGANGSRPSLPIAKATNVSQKPAKQAPSILAVKCWERCIPATDAEPYIHRKRGKPDGLRV